jgi:phage tail sheath protein FI
MAVPVSYPGVYIYEFAPGAPIQGVGTSTAAFIGPAARGPLDLPTKVTSWDQFLATFGEQPLPGFFLWYAVRGFFENGGQVCYIVRASNGEYASVVLNNRAGDPLVLARAFQPGNPTSPIQVTVTATHLIDGTTTHLYQPTGEAGSLAGRELTLTDAGEAAQFRPGDWLDVAGQRVQLVRVTGANLRLGSDLNPVPVTPAAVRLADAPAGTQVVRIQPGAPFPAGTLTAGATLTFTQDGTSATAVVAAVQTEPISPSLTTYRVTLREGLAVPLSLDPDNPADVQSEDFDLTVAQGAATSAYTSLAPDPAHPRYYLNLVNNSDKLVELELIEPPPIALPPDNLPEDTSGAIDLTGGADENLAGLAENDYLAALAALEEVDDVNLVTVPDSTSLAVQQAVIAHCELMADRFAVLDSQPGAGLFGADSVETQRLGLDSTRGYAALYYPWLRVLPATAGAPILVPPSGHVCGVIARSDTTRGVHKAPANEILNGSLGVERTMSDIDQGQLNLIGVNVVRIFQAGGRPVLWGARTTATDRNWQYVNIRRLFLFLEESIEEGIRWSIFEPNNLQLWQKLKRTITEFLTRVWRDGGLFGATPEEAFYVRIDATNNPFSDQALGRLNIEIGIRPTYPAEFIIVSIGIWPGGSEVTEA